MRNHTERTIKGKIFVMFIALILLTQLRETVKKIPLKDRRYWSEHEFLEKVASYTKVHFEHKYKDVYSVPTASQRLVFDLLGLQYTYKGITHNDINGVKQKEDATEEQEAIKQQSETES